MEKANGQRQFTCKLFQELNTEYADKNLVFSPLSIYVALAMIQLGAKDNTDKKLRPVLGMNSEPEDFHTWLKIVLQSLKQNSELQLYFAEKICLQKGIPLIAEFQSALTNLYSADLAHYDFTSNKFKICDEINDWIKKQTNNKINQLLTPSLLEPDTLLVLVTALYMKAPWLNQFLTRKTIPYLFQLSDNTKVEVEMMEQTATFKYIENKILKCRMLQLPYLDKSICMYIILADNLQEFEKSLSYENLSQLINGLTDSQVNVKLPKFEMESTFPLKKALSMLGLDDLFSERTANLSGISTTNKIYLSSFVHKTTLEVTEAGTEAAAASAVVGRNKRSLPLHDVIEFVADRPFLYFVQDSRSGIILFMGRLSQPKSKYNTVKTEL